jgi:hypothetical protein
LVIADWHYIGYGCGNVVVESWMVMVKVEVDRIASEEEERRKKGNGERRGGEERGTERGLAPVVGDGVG